MEELALAIAGASCKCVKCTSPLSVFPVVLYQGGSICGRCFIPNDIEPTCIRNSSYETIAQFVKFPCQYEEFGCQEKVTPSKMNSHENTCRYKQYPCPIVFCTWKGELDKIHDHWTDLHANFILTDPKFELDLVHEYEEVYLIQLEDATFVFHISVDDKKDEFCHSLYCIDDYKSTNGYIYHLEFMKQFSSKSFSLPELPVSDSDYLSFNQTDAPKVNIKDIINELQDPLFVVCSINIDHNVTKNRKLSLQKQGAENHFLTILECPVCQEYMIPPIYQCLAGHAICNICKDLVKSCPECRGEIGNTRNFRLEQMTEHIEFPCKYSNCPFTSTADKIKDHEAACILSIYNCPFKQQNECKWSGFYSAIVDHVHDQHPEEIVQLPVITFICEGLNDLNYIDYNILPACGQLFMVCFQYSTGQFSWTVQFLGPKDDARNYTYELDFKDNTGTNKRLFVKRLCSPLTKYEEMFDNEQEVLLLNDNLLQPLINGGDLIYSCNISTVS